MIANITYYNRELFEGGPLIRQAFDFNIPYVNNDGEMLILLNSALNDPEFMERRGVGVIEDFDEVELGDRAYQWRTNRFISL